MVSYHLYYNTTINHAYIYHNIEQHCYIVFNTQYLMAVWHMDTQKNVNLERVEYLFLLQTKQAVH